MAVKLSLLTGMDKMEVTCNFENILVSQESSAVAALIDLYSVEDGAIVGFFFDF